MLLLATVVALASAAPPPQDSASSVRPAFRACGIDRSRSNAYLGVAIDACAQVILRAKAGDVVVVRWISDRSYASGEQVVRLRLPAVKARQCTNTFDTNCRGAARAERRRLDDAKRRAVAILHAAQPARAPMTDIFGMMAAASDFFSEAPVGTRKLLYLTGDMESNVARGVDPKLDGVEVYAVAQQTSASPRRTAQLRDSWRARFRRLGAVSVHFLSDMSAVP